RAGVLEALRGRRREARRVLQHVEPAGTGGARADDAEERPLQVEGVRRGGEDDVELARVRGGVRQRVAADDLDGQAEAGGVAPYHGRGGLGELHAHGLEAAARRLEAHRARPGVEVEEAAPRLEGEDVEERLAQAGGAGAG